MDAERTAQNIVFTLIDANVDKLSGDSFGGDFRSCKDYFKVVAFELPVADVYLGE